MALWLTGSACVVCVWVCVYMHRSIDGSVATTIAAMFVVLHAVL